MTAWELTILEELARRYQKSAHATGGRKLRLRPEQAFPALDRRNPDDYESFLESCESLEKKGIATIVWARRAKGENLESLVLENPDALFSALDRASPSDVCAESRAAARVNAEAGPLFAWLADNLSPKDLESDTLEPSPTTINDAARLARALELVSKGETSPKLPRALSVELFSDSKRIERLLRALQGSLRRAERAGIALPPFELADRSFPETFVAGSLILGLRFGGEISNPSGCVLGIPFETAVKLDILSPVPVRPTSPRLLSVENKESFFDLASRLPSLPFDALLYSGGHPNRAVQTLIRRFSVSGWTLHHAGDLDPDGILILQELSDAAGCPVIPWQMDRAVFERYRSLGRPLEAEAHRRALLVRDETRKRSGLGELLETILEAGVMVEQEIISYY